MLITYSQKSHDAHDGFHKIGRPRLNRYKLGYLHSFLPTTQKLVKSLLLQKKSLQLSANMTVFSTNHMSISNTVITILIIWAKICLRGSRKDNFSHLLSPFDTIVNHFVYPASTASDSSVSNVLLQAQFSHDS